MGLADQWRGSALSLLFPQGNACHLCERWLDGGLQVCPACQQRLDALRMRGPVPVPPGAPLGHCAAVWHFRGEARPLIYQLKYNSDTAIAQFIGEQMSAVLIRQGLAQQVDGLLPVPLHEKRLRQRGYNQAALLAREISLRTGLPASEAALRRVRVTGTLVHSSRQERLAVMDGAFQADAALTAGKRILLIDDVFTTGATSMSCAVALLEAGAREVSVLTACCADGG